jgi:hypothetical protein
MHAANPAPAPPRLRAGALVHPSRGQERQVRFAPQR